MASKEEIKKKFHEFLASKCEGKTEYLNNRRVREEFKSLGNGISDFEISFWMGEFKKNVFKITDEDERIRLLFVLGVKISKSYYSKLKKDAHVEWNRNQVITKYISNDGRLRFERNQPDNGEGDNQEEDESLQEEPTPNKRPRVEEEAPAPDAGGPMGIHGATPGPQEQNIEFAQIKEENPRILEEVKPDIGLLEQQPLVNQMPAKPILPLDAHKSFLNCMKTLISTQNLPIDPIIIQKIGEITGSMERMQLLGAPNSNEINVEDFVTAIQHSALTARRSSYALCAGDSRRLRDFLLCLQFSVANLMMEELKELETKLMESVEDPANLNRRIPTNKMGKAMGSILDLLVPN